MASLVMYTFFKWTIDTKKTGRRNGYFAFYIPQELLAYLNTSELELKDEGFQSSLESRVNPHTRKSSQIRSYFKLRKKSANYIKVLAQNQSTPKALNILLKFPTIFRQKHISNVLFYLIPKNDEWIKYRFEGRKEIYPFDYGLIQKAKIEAITEKDRLISF